MSPRPTAKFKIVEATCCTSSPAGVTIAACTNERVDINPLLNANTAVNKIGNQSFAKICTGGTNALSDALQSKKMGRNPTLA
jgi:hypothetical protein